MSNGVISNRRATATDLLMDTTDPIVKRIPREYRAFVVIFAGFCLQATFGLVYSFGNILPYLTSYLRWKVNPDQTNGSLMWLQSMMCKEFLSPISLIVAQPGFPLRWSQVVCWRSDSELESEQRSELRSTCED